MREGFKVLSLSYKKAPVEIREVLSIDDALAKEFLEEFVQVAEVSDLMVLSTCNRTEIYYSHSHNLSNELIGFLCAKKGLTNSSQYAQYFDSIACFSIYLLFRWVDSNVGFKPNLREHRSNQKETVKYACTRSTFYVEEWY